MKRRTTLRVSLLVAAALFFLSSVNAQTPEKSVSSVSPTPSSQSPRESEVPPEQKFVELSRTKKLSAARRRPPSSRRLRTSTAPPEPSTEPTKAPPSTTEVPTTAAPTQPLTTSSPPPTSPPSQRQDTTDKQVHFTGIRAAKSDRGQVFTFTFQNPKDNSVKEELPTPSRIPARFSPVFTSQTVKRRGSVPQTSSETNQPDNLVINSGPPGDIPRVRPSGRALNPSAGAGQANQISQSENSEEKTVPVNTASPSTERPVKILRQSLRPKSKTRPREGQVILPDVPATPDQLGPPQRALHLVIANDGQDLARENLPAPPRPNRPIKEGPRGNQGPPEELPPTPDQPGPPQRQLQLIIANDGQDLARENLPAPPRPDRPIEKGPRFLPNQGPPEELPPQPSREIGEPSLQTLNLNEGQDPSVSPAPPRIRYVKAGSLRFFPNRPGSTQYFLRQIPRDFAEPPTQAFTLNEDPIARENLPERPGLPVRSLRPGSIRLLPAQAFPEDLPPEQPRNFAEPTLQTLVANEEQDPSTRENLPPRPNRPLRPGSLRLVPKFQPNSQEVPPELLRDFANANLQTLISNGDQNSGRLSSTAAPITNRPLNPEALRFIANKPGSLEEVPLQVPRDFAPPGPQRIRGNEGQDGPANENLPRPNRPLNADPIRFLANHPEIPPEVARQLLREFSGPTLQTLTANEESRDRLQERPNRPSKAGSLTILPNIPQGVPPQPPRDFADPNLQALIENQRQGPARFSSPQPNRLSQPGPLRLIPSGTDIPGEQQPPPGRDLSDANIQNLPLDGRRVLYSQSARERLLPQTPETHTRSQSTNFESEVNAFRNSPERPASQANNIPNQLQPNQPGEPARASSPISTNIPQPTEQPSPQLLTTNTPPRVQPTPQTPNPSPGFFANPQTNIPRLIIEFPSPTAPGDSSIRLQLNPNNLPTNSGPAISPQPSIQRAPIGTSPSPTPNEPTGLNQQAVSANSGAVINPPSNDPQISAQLQSAPADPSPRNQLNNQALLTNAGLAINTQANNEAFSSNAGLGINTQANNQALPSNAGLSINTQANNQALPTNAGLAVNTRANNQALLTNAGLATNTQTNTPRLPLEFPTSPASVGVFNNLQQAPTNTGSFLSTPSNIAQTPVTSVQPNPQLQRANLGPSVNSIPNAQGIQNQLPLASSPAVRNPSSLLHPSSQALASNSQLAINPLTKTLAFSNQPSPLPATATRDSSSRAELSSQTPATNPGLALNSLSNTRILENSLSRESITKQQSNLQVLNQGPNPSSPSNERTLPNEIPTTPRSVSREVLNENAEVANNSSLNSQKISAQLKPADASKSNQQVPPVDVHLTINFNSNIPGFSAPPQPATQSNASQQINPTFPPQLSSSIIPNVSQPPSHLLLQPVNSGLAINPSTVSPFDLSQTATSAPIRSQQDFQTPVNFGSTFNPQFNQQAVTQATPLPSQPFSQIVNSNPGSSVNSQFNNAGRPFELQSAQSSQAQTQNYFARFQQNSQFLPPNVGPSINSQFNIPGRPFQLQSQQPQQDFLARFQPNSQFFSGNAGSVNSQFNSFSQVSSPSPPTQQNTFSQATPQVFTTNAGLAVNNLSFSPGLSVELLPPTATGAGTNQRISTRNEQPPVNFLVNSPELSADLQPPVISQSSISPQPQPSQQPPITQFSSISFQSNTQGLPLNAGRNFPTHLLQLLPPIDPLFPQAIKIDDPPNPVDIPKPAVPALVPPPREQLTIPIDIPKPDVPALVPPPREPLNIPIDIPRPDVPALVPPPREPLNIPIDIPKPDVPALVPPPREHIDIPIDIPKPDVPALVPPPRPSDLARLLPPTPTTFTFNPSNLQENVNQANIQPQQPVKTSTDNPVLILPKSSSRQQFAQGRLNPIPIEDLSKKIGFLPQNQPAPFSAPFPTPSVPTGTGGRLQITDIQAGRLRPIVQEVLTDAVRPPPSANREPASQPITFIKAPVHVGLEPPLIPFSQSPQQSPSGKNQNNFSQSFPAILTPTQTLTPPPGQDTTTTSTTSSSQQPTAESASSVGPTSTPDTLQTLPQPPQEGFIIFQTPTITVTTQSNRPDSPINVRVVTQGGTGLIKPNTTLTAEPERPANPQTSLFIQPEGSVTSTVTPSQQFGSTTPSAIGTSTVPDLPSTSTPLNQRTSADSSQAASFLAPLDSGFNQNNFSFNPFTPQFTQPFPLNPVRLSNVTFNAFHGPGTACPKLELQHKGHKAPQFGGNLILSPGFYPPEDPLPKLCTKPPGIEGKKFNWWQILLSHGGEPSTLSRTNEAEDVKIPDLRNPCVRPFETDGVPVFYNVTKTDAQTYYREEIAYHRLPEAQNTFLESRGLFVYKQAKSSFDSAAFLVLYTRDDSGFWVQIKNVQCNFNRNLQPNLQCRSLPECLCEGGEKRCTESIPVLTRNFPINAFRF